MELSNGVIALIATLFGGVGLKITESWLHRNRDKIDVDLQYREELRRDLLTIKEELRKSNEETATWRDKYYDEQERVIEQQRSLSETMFKLQQALSLIEKYTEERNDSAS